jgi:prepilin-type N-terminal cleavage/methylation domain-containing protein
MSGFTLMEIVVVIIIMGIIATVALRSIDNTLETTKVETTKQEMQQLAYAFAGNPGLVSNGLRTDFGYVGDVGAMPPNFDALAANPGGYGTWSGPYISSSFAEAGDDYKYDGWGQAYSLQGATIQSTGGGGTLTKAIAASVADLTNNSVVGYVTDAAGNPPGDSAATVSVTLSYPDGSGGMNDSTVTVSSSGAFDFSSTVPIGNHRLQAIHTSTADTVVSYISVLPGGTAYATLRIPGAPWSVAPGGGGGGGGAQATGSLIFVPGSSRCEGSSNQHVRFEIYNESASTISVDWLIATYTQTPQSYYQRVRWESATVFNSNNPRAASGDTVTFTSTQTIQDGTTRLIRIQRFRDTQSGGGAWVDMSGVEFTVEFSDGSIVTFNSGN